MARALTIAPTCLRRAPQGATPGGMSRPQLAVLNEVLQALFGPDASAAYVDEVLEQLQRRGVAVGRGQLVAELEAASEGGYDERPLSERWGPKLYYDPADGGTVCPI